MGVVSNISYTKFPKQGEFQGARCEVRFEYKSEIIMGTILRDDVESPDPGNNKAAITAILLDDGRLVLSTECQYAPLVPFKFRVIGGQV